MNTSRIYQTLVLFFLSISLFAQSNNALNFDGVNDYVLIPNANQINFGTSTDFTLESWIKLYGAQSWTGIFAKAGDSSWYQVFIVSNHVSAELYSNGTFAGNIDGTTNLNDGQWHHVAMVVTRATTNVKWYVDGVLEYDNTTGFNGNLDNSGDLLLGSSRGNANHFNGSIDEVRIWNVARTQTEIQNNKGSEIDPATSGLVAYYRFNQGIAGGDNSGVTTLLDLTSYGNNGTLNTFALNGSTSNWVAANNSALPVELTSFTANYNDGKVLLNWQTATEVNNYGFEIELRIENGEWRKIGFLQGHGNSNSPKSYSFEDANPVAGKVQYRLKQIDFDGKYEYSDVVDVKVEAPAQFKLAQNFPNPFNPTTTIKYSIPGNVETPYMASLRVFDMLGREVATLVNEQKAPGNYEVKFDASNLASGLYFYKLQSGQFAQTKKLILIK